MPQGNMYFSSFRPFFLSQIGLASFCSLNKLNQLNQNKQWIPWIWYDSATGISIVECTLWCFSSASELMFHDGLDPVAVSYLTTRVLRYRSQLHKMFLATNDKRWSARKKNAARILLKFEITQWWSQKENSNFETSCFMTDVFTCIHTSLIALHVATSRGGRGGVFKLRLIENVYQKIVVTKC